MGAGSSSDRRRRLSVAATGGLEGAVFQQRSQDTSGLKGTRGVSVDDSCNDDFTDISYSEGGGIISHQDIPVSSSHYRNSPGNSARSIIKTTSSSASSHNSLSHHHPQQVQQHIQHPQQPSPSNNRHRSTLDDNDKENTTPGRVSLLDSQRRTIGMGNEHELQRALPQDTKGTMKISSSSSGGNIIEDRGGLVIERQSSEMSFLITPPPPEHPASPDLPQDESAPIDSSSGDQRHAPGRGTGDLMIEEVL